MKKIKNFVIGLLTIAAIMGIALFGAKLLGADYSSVTLPHLPGSTSTPSSSSVTTSTTTTPGSTTTPTSSSLPTSVDNRKDLVIIDLKNTSSGTAVNPASLYQLFGHDHILYPTDDHQEDTTHFDFDKLFLDNGGLRFGSSSAIGWARFVFEEEYDNIALIGYAYNNANPTTEKWSCDIAKVEIEYDYEDEDYTVEHEFSTNNGEYRAPDTDTIILTHPTNYPGGIQTVLITGLEKRFTLISIEMWNNEV